MSTHTDGTRRPSVEALPFAALAFLGVVMVIVAARWDAGTSANSGARILMGDEVPL